MVTAHTDTAQRLQNPASAHNNVKRVTQNATAAFLSSQKHNSALTVWYEISRGDRLGWESGQRACAGISFHTSMLIRTQNPLLQSHDINWKTFVPVRKAYRFSAYLFPFYSSESSCSPSAFLKGIKLSKTVIVLKDKAHFPARKAYPITITLLLL